MDSIELVAIKRIQLSLRGENEKELLYNVRIHVIMKVDLGSDVRLYI